MFFLLFGGLKGFWKNTPPSSMWELFTNKIIDYCSAFIGSQHLDQCCAANSCWSVHQRSAKLPLPCKLKVSDYQQPSTSSSVSQTNSTKKHSHFLWSPFSYKTPDIRKPTFFRVTDQPLLNWGFSCRWNPGKSALEMLNLVLVLRTQARFSQMVEMLRVFPLILLGGDLLMMCMCSYHEEGLYMFLKG